MNTNNITTQVYKTCVAVNLMDVEREADATLRM